MSGNGVQDLIYFASGIIYVVNSFVPYRYLLVGNRLYSGTAEMTSFLRFRWNRLLPMKKRVALLVETSSSYGRNVLSGIGRYMRIHPNWSVFLEQRALEDELPGWLMDWQGDGIISRSSTPQLIAQSRKQNVPLVELTDRNSELLIPHVRSDDDQIGQLAAEHLTAGGRHLSRWHWRLAVGG